MKDHYILCGHQAVQTSDLEDWAHWYECANRRVAESRNISCTISTIFLGLDHQTGDGPPLLFETMVFGGWMHGRSWRGTTWAEAEKQHRDVCQLLGVEHD